MQTNECYEALKAMNTLARMMNDENFYYGIWTYIIPDCATDEELIGIATEDPDTFGHAVRAFNAHYSQYAQEGGLYIDGEVYV